MDYSLKGIVKNMKKFVFGVGMHTLPLLAAISGFLFVTINFISAVFITHNSSISHELPPISGVSMYFPERVFFTVGINVMSFFVFFVCCQRFNFLYDTWNAVNCLCGSVFAIICIVFLGCATTIAAISYADNHEAHNVSALFTFLMICVLAHAIFWQDVHMAIKKTPWATKKWLVFRGISLAIQSIFLVFLVFFLCLSFWIIPKGTLDHDIWFSIFSGFEYSYFFVSMVFFSTLSIDSFFIKEYQKELLEKKILEARTNHPSNPSNIFSTSNEVSVSESTPLVENQL